MNSDLLLAKLRIPAPRPTLVERPRLLAGLDQSLPRDRGWQRRLTVLSAPAGYGKTTLLCQWLAAGDRPVAWLSLDRNDNDPVRFLTYLIAALRQIEPDLGAGAIDLIQSAAVSASAPATIDRALTALLNEFERVDTPSILVLDDYHLIENIQVHAAVSFLLENPPPALHLVVASRADPPLPVARLRAQGQLTELHAKDLSFSSAEAIAFLNRAMTLHLTEGQVDALVKRTEGWIAGLQLAALALRRIGQGMQTHEISTFIADFTGSHRFVLDYLTEEVLHRQDAEIRDFLLQTAVLERLCASLCDELTGRNDGQDVLENLAAANLFIVPLDDQRQWYRYHHLFADLLRQRLQREQPAQVPALHRKAGAWFEAQDRPDEAIYHALEAGRPEHAAALIERYGWTVLMRGEMNTLLRRLAALPDEIVAERASLNILRAWAFAFSAQWAAAHVALQAGDGTAAPGQIAAVRAYGAAVQGDIERTVELAGQALEHLDQEEMFPRALVTYCRAITYFSSGQPVPAGQALGEVIRLGRLAGQHHLVITATAHLGHVYEMQGRLRQALATHREALRLAAEVRDRPVLFQGIATVGIAEILYEMNDLAGTLHHARQGIALTERGGFMSYMLVGYAQLLRVFQAQGDAERAQKILQKGKKLAEQHQFRYMQSVFAELQVRQWLAEGDVERAWLWAREQIGRQDRTTDLAHEKTQMAVIRALLARARQTNAQLDGSVSTVQGMLANLLRGAEAAGRTASVIGIVTLQAVAAGKRGEEERALAALGRALALAEPEGYVRLFVDEGPPLAQLLRLALARRMSPSYVAALLAVFGESAPPAAAALAEPLSEREVEVLRLIVAGLSNREIADELVIAVSTVKSHINNIYGKLGVKRRAQAIARSRELELL